MEEDWGRTEVKQNNEEIISVKVLKELNKETAGLHSKRTSKRIEITKWSSKVFIKTTKLPGKTATRFWQSADGINFCMLPFTMGKKGDWESPHHVGSSQ